MSAVMPGAGGRVVQLTAWCLVVGCAAVLLVSFWLPWYWHDSMDSLADDYGGTAFLLAVLGPGAVLVCLGWVVHARDPLRATTLWWLFAAAVVAGLLVGWRLLAVVAVVSTFRIGVGGPLALVSAVGLAAGWFTLAVSATAGSAQVFLGTLVRRSGLVSWVATGMVVAVLAGGGAFVVSVLAVTAFVDHTTAAALPQMRPAAPRTLGRERWRVRADGVVAATVAGRYTVLGERHGVRVLDSTNGSERWHYRHRVMTAERAVVSANNQTVFLLLSDGDGRYIAVGLDVATGTVRWRWAEPQFLPDWLLLEREVDQRPSAAVAAGNIVALGEVCDLCQGVAGYDVRTGRLEWEWWSQGESQEDECELHRIAAADQQILVADVCVDYANHEAKNVVSRVTALSADDGSALWTWHQDPPMLEHLPYRYDGPRLTVNSDDIMVNYRARSSARGESAPRRVVRLSADGAERGDYRDPRRSGARQPLAVADDVAVFPDTSESVGLDVDTGAELWRRDTSQLAGWTVELAATHADQVYLLLAKVTEEEGRDGRRYPASGVVRLAALSANDGAMGPAPEIDLRPAPHTGEDTEDCRRGDCLANANTYLGVGPGVLVVTADSVNDIDVVGIG